MPRHLITRPTPTARGLRVIALAALAVLSLAPTCDGDREPDHSPTTQPANHAPTPGLAVAPEDAAAPAAGAQEPIEAAGAREQELVVPTPDHGPIDGMAPPPERDQAFRRGVSLGLFIKDLEPDAFEKTHYGAMLEEIARLGATDVEVVVRWSQESIRSHDLAPHPDVSVSDEILRWVIADARDKGLRVFLLPIITLRVRAEGEWRGKMAPSDPDAWWEAYRRFILHHADIAAQEKVDMLSVGSELASMEGDKERWEALIEAVEERFDGQLTYSANWDHFEGPTFWDRLDVMGVSAYHEITDAPDPDLATLRDGWRPFVERLDAFAQEQGKPYIFTEIGYPSHSLAAARPWDYRPQGTVDNALQARLFRAVVEVWQDQPRMHGMYAWNWFGFPRPGDRGYMLRGKPAAEVLEYWYKASRPRP